MKPLAALLLAVVVPPAPAAPALPVLPPALQRSQQRTLTPGQMEEDLFLLTDTLEREHPGLLRYASREEIDEAFGEALHAIEEERTVLEFYRVVARLVSRVRCGHTRVRIGGVDRRVALDEKGLLPIEVHLVGERAWVLATLGDDVPLEPGQEILAIDGLPFPEVRARAFAGLFTDGFGETGKQRELERRFAEHYALLVDDGDQGGRHQIAVAGLDEALWVEGISTASWDARPPRPPGPPRTGPRPLVDLSRPAPGVGLLSVRAFGDPGGGEPTFPELLEKSFVELEQDGVQHLVLDLRGNGGGRDEYGALLVSYLTAEPFGYFERIEVTPGYEGEGGIVERDGMRLVTTHPGLQIQQPAEHAFAGDVFVLTDGWTFSTAADVATVAHHNGLATFVGEETGGGYDGNTSGRTDALSLPNSGIAARVPLWMYTTANVGHARSGRGAPVDHPVRPTVEDVLAGRDAELELTLRLIRRE